MFTVSAAGAPRAPWWALPDNHHRMGVHTHTSTQPRPFSAAWSLRVSHAWNVYDTMMGSGGLTWYLPGMRSMASVATSSLSRALACTRLGAICGTAECSQRARRAAHIGSLRSDVWCVSRPEWRGEAPGREWEKPWGGWWESDRSSSCVFVFFRSRVS